MKNTLITALSLLFIISCKKNEITATLTNSQESNSIQYRDEYLSNVKKYLIDSISAADYRNIDFSKAIVTKFDSGRIFLLRLQFKKPDNEFILLKTDASGLWSKGLILNIKYAKGIQQNELLKKPHSFNGNIIVSSLNRKGNNNFQIRNGFREDSTKNPVLPSGNTLPDVVVTAYIPSSGSISYADWYNLLDLYAPAELGIYGYGNNGGSSNSYYGYFSPTDPYSYGNQQGGGLENADPKVIEYENPETLPDISIYDYMNCFGNISDEGATCSIEIFSDLPVNGEPNTFFNWQDGSPGHTFLQIKKSNGDESIQQNIGFYPNQGWKTVLYTPVASKLVDNGGHKFNASLKMNLTSAQLHSVITEIENLSNSSYDMDQYNCTDFALQVFNTVRPGNELTIPLYVLPGNTSSIKSKTPQGLYQQLMNMLEDGNSESANITYAGVCGYVGGSKGPCN